MAERVEVERVQLWRDNLLDEEWDIPLPRLAQRFWKSRRGRQVKAGTLRLAAAVDLFITDPAPKGLQSVVDAVDADRILAAVYESRPWGKED